MLIAYLDEFGHVGPYVSQDHPKYNQHPVFGYAGFVLPAGKVRELGSTFTHVKRELFKTEIIKSKTPNQWERKGNEFFSTGSIRKRPEQVKLFKHLLNKLDYLGGKIFYYGELKQRGTVKQVKLSSAKRTSQTLKESINRLCMHADKNCDELLIIMDQITDKSRKELVAEMYAHVYWRSKSDQDHPEMRRIVDAPLHIESNVNGSIQFADWICGLMSRLSHWQLVPGSEFSWASDKFGEALRGRFTFDSKLYLRDKPNDIFNAGILDLYNSRLSESSLGNRAKIPENFLEVLEKAQSKD